MSTPLKLRATEALCTSTGGHLAATDPYEPVLVDGALHPEDQAHYDAGRLVVADERKVNKEGEAVGKAPELPTAPLTTTPALEA